MRLSYFTPTNDPKYLLDLYKTILAQSGDISDWEWVIVINGGITTDNLSESIKNDPRVKIYSSEAKTIGGLKKYACEMCSGYLLIEVDHDDLLVPTTTSSLLEACIKEPEGFYYSDFINIKENGRCETFPPKYGWETYYAIIDNKRYAVNRAFEPSARSLCQIYYAPNHIRAWSRPAYLKSGGYDENMMVGDDHDLLCRTYVAQVPFVHIKEPLYIYRRHENNSFVLKNQELQTQQLANMNKYLHPLIHEECNRNKKIRLNLGNKLDTIHEVVNYNLLHEGLEKHLPFENDSVGFVTFRNTLNKIPKNKIVRLMNEIYRVLCKGGWFYCAVPSITDNDGYFGKGAVQDPTAESYWCENNFLYFTQREFAECLYSYFGKFQQVRLTTEYPSEWHRHYSIPYVYADLCALKGQRQAGECKI